MRVIYFLFGRTTTRRTPIFVAHEATHENVSSPAGASCRICPSCLIDCGESANGPDARCLMIAACCRFVPMHVDDCNGFENRWARVHC